MFVPYLDLKSSNRKNFQDIAKALKRVVDSGQLILGEELSKFEEEYSKFSGTNYAIGVANGLDALILSLMTVGIGEGDEVIVPSNTYIATLLAVSRVGAKPVLVEPKIDTYNIDSSKVSVAITSKTRAIIPVHLFGQACEMNEIMTIAKKYNLLVIEDNAQSHGAEYRNKKTGSFGIANGTSFYPGKNLAALGDGGAITTDDKNIYEQIKVLRNYGSKVKYVNELVGYNSRLDELQAAFLRTKLKLIKESNRKRIKIAQTYAMHLSGVGDLILPKTALGSTHVFHVFTVRSTKRDEFQKYLGMRGVTTLIHYPIPPHLQKAYSSLGLRKGDFPIAEELARTSLSIPIFPEMTYSQIEYVISAIKEFFN